MSLSPPEDRAAETLADLLARLGSISPERIPARPAPGTAKEEDVFRRPGGEKRLYELVDGVLVEKPVGYYESLVAGVLIQVLRNYLDQHDLGIVLGADGTLRLAPGLVRLPDVSFISWERLPDRSLPDEPIPDLVPDLAVEVLSHGNTPQEMERKLQEYLRAGVRLVWYVDPTSGSARVYRTEGEALYLDENGVLEGGEVLPGFRLPLGEWFDRAGRRPRA